MLSQYDAIAAISTPLGAGGIGVVRISGKYAPEIAARIFRAKGGRRISDMPGYTSLFGRIYDGSEPVDDAVCQIFREPRSYTGENVVELSCHGGVWIMRKVLRLCLENGARAADPGEFTKRAFINGKLGLTQAEAVMDIISAQGKSAVRAALSARDGAVAARVGRIADRLVEQSAHLAAWADFPDEDLEELDLPLLDRALGECAAEISTLLTTYDAGRVFREGVQTVIAGTPNVGKSTLMNLLSGWERSIVTDIPGTTRDVIEDVVRLDDFVLCLSDTAGIRETSDPVEIAGVERTRTRIQSAELVLAVFDGSRRLDADDLSLLNELSDKPCIAVINKADLPRKLDISAIEARLNRALSISVRTGEGMDKLKRAISELLGVSALDPSAGIVMNERQRICLLNAESDICEAKSALADNMLDAVTVCVDSAVDELLTLTGERASERVVNEIFARFCVGK